MKTIDVDDEVFSELARKAVGFDVKPNDVIRQLLGLAKAPHTPVSNGHHAPIRVDQVTSKPNIDSSPAAAAGDKDSLHAFVENPRFQQQGQSIIRFLLLLGWAHGQNAAAFSRVVTDYQRGNRRYFGRSQEQVEKSGVGISAKPIPKSSFWVLSTLDNKAKRTIIEDVFQSLSFSPGDINLAKAQLADSGIRRQRHVYYS